MRHRQNDADDGSDHRNGGGDGIQPKPLVMPSKQPPAPKATARTQPARIKKATSRSRRRGDAAEENEAPPVRKRSRAARHPLVLALNLIVLLVVMALIGSVAAVVIGRQMYLAQGPLERDVGVIIERGSRLTDIAIGLEERGIISNQFVFMGAAVATGASGRIQAGEYRIPAHATMADVLDRIQSGRVVQHQITIPEGLTSAQIVRRLEAQDVLTGPIDVVPAEGTLLPETYRYTRGMTRERLINVMKSEMDKVVAQAWANRDPTLPLASPEDLVTLASIVEKETGLVAERERVAGVFANRLRQRMRLQSDPTILYGLYGGEAWSEPRTIYRSDLEKPNRYNTYQIPALPPGPIANPGRAAIEATANPATTDDLFFVADGSGGHAFATTYEEHLRNVERWREVERRRSQGN